MAEPSDAALGVIPATYGEALSLLVSRDFLKSQKWQEQQWRADRKAADHRILLFEQKFIKRMSKLGVPMFAHCVVRSLAEQTARYVQGNSKAKAGQSAHNYGMAVDLIHSIRAWDMSERQWALIGHVGKEVAAQNGLDLVWGGDWKALWDPAHWEVKGWRYIAGL